MRFGYNEDQATLFTVLSQMLGSSAAEFRTVGDWGRFDYGAELDAQLEENGFFDAAGVEELGPVAAAEMVAEIAQLPVAVECAASALLRPFLGEGLPRPLAVVVDDAPGAIRFLPMARALLSISDGGLRVAELRAGDARPVDSLYAYPMGEVAANRLDWRDVEADPAELRVLWQIAIGAELSGVLKGGLDAVLAHVRERAQFGRPLGSFQGVQHRLATDAVRIDGARLQVLRAAQSRSAQDAAAALGYAQSVATQIGYDLHQFMGAMGLTLEHPLHRWSYRARLLRADLGGASSAFQAYANARWGAA